MAPNPDANPDEVGLLVGGMDRNQLIDALRHFESKVPLDFDSAYLANLPLPKLRHLLWTAILCLSPM